MKKKIILCCVLTILLTSRLAHASPQVEIYNYEGRVSVLRNGKTLQPDLDFTSQTGDILRVEQDSTLDLSLNYLVGLRFFGPAVCTLSDIEPSNVKLKMDSGTVMVNMKVLPSDATFEIETPTVIVSSKLAKFLVKITQQADNTSATATTVKVGTANVYIKSSSSAVTIIEGRHLDIAEGGSIPSTQVATEEDLKPLQRVLSVYIVEPPAEGE